MVKKLGELGLVAHEPYRGVRLTDAGAPAGARGAAPPPPARALPGRGARHAVGPRPRRGRGARARPLRGARGAHRRQARRSDARSRTATRSRRADLDASRSADTRRAATLDAGARGRLRARLGLRPRDASLPRRARHRAGRRASRSSTSSPSAARCSPASASDVHVLGGALARAMRVEVDAVSTAASAVADGVVALPAPSALQRLARARPRSAARSPLLGPAFVAAIAYVDPGNFATNIAGGAKYGYLLLWVIARREPDGDAHPEPVGQGRHRHGPQPPRAVPRALPAPGRPGACGSRPSSIAMATDLAEFVGAAIALNLLFGVPLFAAGLITAVVAFAILGLQTRGYRRFEIVDRRPARRDPARLPLRHAADRLRRRRGAPAASSRASRHRTRSCSPPASSARR